MEAHFDISDEEFETRFANCQLDPVIFTHEAHLRLAWLHIKKYGAEQAVENICNQLLKYVVFAGAADKFNKTLTVAAVRAVDHFIRKSPVDRFDHFIQQYPRLKFNFRELIACHYTNDIYQSEKAKKEYLEPDLLPFS